MVLWVCTAAYVAAYRRAKDATAEVEVDGAVEMAAALALGMQPPKVIRRTWCVAQHRCCRICAVSCLEQDQRATELASLVQTWMCQLGPAVSQEAMRACWSPHVFSYVGVRFLLLDCQISESSSDSEKDSEQ